MAQRIAVRFIPPKSNRLEACLPLPTRKMLSSPLKPARKSRAFSFGIPSKPSKTRQPLFRTRPPFRCRKPAGHRGFLCLASPFMVNTLHSILMQPVENACELMTFEHCYGYPLSGEFIRMDYCYDVPRILHCHVNPAAQRYIGGQYSRAVVDAVIAKKTFAYTINHTDNAQIIDLFTFGTYGGILLDSESYGQLTNFNFDCVAVGILKRGNNTKKPQLANCTRFYYRQHRRKSGEHSPDYYRRTGTHFAKQCGSIFRRKRSIDHCS